jgi:NitT/TauT family transport system substrate-binding protein
MNIVEIMPSSLSRARALALLGTASASLATRASRAQATPLRLAVENTDAYAIPLYGVDRGLFAKAGVEAELTTFTQSLAIIAAVTSGALDVGMAGVIEVANAANRGIPIAFFAGGGYYSTSSPTTALVVPKSSTVKAAADMEGKTVGVITLNTISQFAVSEWMQKNGADPAKAKFFEAPFATMGAALARGTIDAAVITEPFLTFLKPDVRWLAKVYDTISNQFYVQAPFATRDWLAKNAATARKVANAMYDAGRWANAHRDESLQTLTKYAKLDPARVEGMARVTYGTSLDDRMVQPILDVAAAYKALPRQMSAQDVIVRI